MNLLAARVVLRPRPLAEVLDLAIPFCLGGKRLLGGLAALLLLPALVVCFYFRAQGWTWPAVWTLALALGDFLSGAFTLASGELMFAEGAGVRAVLGRFARRLPAYLGAHILSRVALAASALIVIALPTVAVRVLFFREAVLLEGAPAVGALGRSARIAQRHGLACFGLLGALLVGTALFVIGGELLGDGAVRSVLQLGRPFGRLIEGGSAYALVGLFLSVPVTAAARFLQYIDLRTRKEGWDIQLKFMALAARGKDREAA